jgi:hypothetical protein
MISAFLSLWGTRFIYVIPLVRSVHRHDCFYIKYCSKNEKECRRNFHARLFPQNGEKEPARRSTEKVFYPLMEKKINGLFSSRIAGEFRENKKIFAFHR